MGSSTAPLHKPPSRPPSLPTTTAPLIARPVTLPPLDSGAFALPSTPPLPTGSFKPPVLVDVTPRALTVETAGGYADTVIARNAKIPCERTRRFATSRDGQTSVRVRVAQGEDTSFSANTFLGELELAGLRAGPRGTVIVSVTFEVDADGTLRVRARDDQTGQEARATLQLVGIANESSVVAMINRVAQQPIQSGPLGS
jgi:molecular chaperone DnaK